MKSLESNSGVSSMRVSLYWVVAMAGLLVVSISASIVVQSVKGDVVDWMGVAASIGAIGVFMAPALGFKSYQKKHENKE